MLGVTFLTIGLVGSFLQYQWHNKEIHFTQEVLAQEPEQVQIEVQIDWTPARIEKQIRETFPESPDLAVAIAKSESGEMLNRNAYNPEHHKGCSGSYGIFQIACVHVDDTQALFDIEYNIQKAREIYLAEGWTPWGGYTSGGYKKYLK